LPKLADEVRRFPRPQFVASSRALFDRFGVQKRLGRCRFFTVFLGGLLPRLASATIATELRCAADTATIPPFRDNRTALTAALGSRIDTDFCHQTQVVLVFAIAALTLQRAASKAPRIEGLPAVSAFNPNADLASTSVPRLECGVRIRTDLKGWRSRDNFPSGNAKRSSWLSPVLRVTWIAIVTPDAAPFTAKPLVHAVSHPAPARETLDCVGTFVVIMTQ
jgi:hypothetical protein